MGTHSRGAKTCECSATCSVQHSACATNITQTRVGLALYSNRLLAFSLALFWAGPRVRPTFRIERGHHHTEQLTRNTHRHHQHHQQQSTTRRQQQQYHHQHHDKTNSNRNSNSSCNNSSCNNSTTNHHDNTHTNNHHQYASALT